MARRTKTIELPLEQRVRESHRQATSMSLPLAVHHRLDELADLAGDTNPTRGEIIAALIALAPTEPETLEELVMRYRKLTVRDLAQDADGAGATVVRLDERRPGRPRHRGAS